MSERHENVSTHNHEALRNDEEPRGKVVREWVTGLLVPISIFAYTVVKDKSDERQRILDRDVALIRSLGSASALERTLASAYIDQLPATEHLTSLQPVLEESCAQAPTSAEATSICNTLASVQEKVTSEDESEWRVNDKQKASTETPKALPYRVYVQIQDEADREVARRIQKLWLNDGLRVPAIETINNGNNSTEIRYFREEDKPKAQSLSEELSKAGIPTVSEDASGYARKMGRNVPPEQLELWLAPTVNKLHLTGELASK